VSGSEGFTDVFFNLASWFFKFSTNFCTSSKTIFPSLLVSTLLRVPSISEQSSLGTSPFLQTIFNALIASFFSRKPDLSLSNLSKDFLSSLLVSGSEGFTDVFFNLSSWFFNFSTTFCTSSKPIFPSLLVSILLRVPSISEQRYLGILPFLQAVFNALIASFFSRKPDLSLSSLSKAFLSSLLVSGFGGFNCVRINDRFSFTLILVAYSIVIRNAIVRIVLKPINIINF